jgi:hypothetical protein
MQGNKKGAGGRREDERKKNKNEDEESKTLVFMFARGPRHEFSINSVVRVNHTDGSDVRRPRGGRLPLRALESSIRFERLQ